MAFTNFMVIGGYGQGLVVSTADQSFINQIYQKTSDSNNPIVKGLNILAFIVITLSFISVFIYLTVWFGYLRHVYYSTGLLVLTNVLNLIATGIPFGLPVVITAGLFVILHRLRKSDIVVKNIFDIASLSGIDVVLTDKTGTLTRNSVEITNVFYSTKEINVDLCYESPDVYLGARNGLKELLDLCDFCCPEGSCSNMIEKVLFEFAQRNRAGSSRLIHMYDIIDEVVFTSTNKYQIRLIKPKTGYWLTHYSRGQDRR